MSRYIELDRDKFKLSLERDRVALLGSVHYLLGMKKLSIEDVVFCTKSFIQSGYLHESVIFLREALKIYPKIPHLYKIFIKVLYRLNLLEESLVAVNKLLNISQDIETYILLAKIFEKARDFKNALVVYEKAKKLDEKNSSLYVFISELYKKIGRVDLSLKSLKEASEQYPNDKEMLLLYANELFHQNLFLDAQVIYEKIINLDDKYISAYVNLGVVKKELAQYSEAHKLYEKALELSPQNSGVYNNLGVLYKVEKKFYKAFVSIKEAIALNPKSADAHANMGAILKETNKPRWALKCFERAISLNPMHINANVDYAMANLLLQDYKKGLFHYEHRVRMREFLPKFIGLNPAKMYKKGMDIRDKRILVFSEQGFGDTLQFIRFIKLLQERGAFVILRVKKELKRLFELNSIADKIILEGEDEEYDYHLPLLSILYLFDIDPNSKALNLPYLKAKTEIKKESKIRKIAFCFGGSQTHKGHKYRFIEPQNFEFLTKLKNTKVYSLQIGEESKKLKKCTFYKNIIDKTDEIDDFYDTSLLLSEMDLIITSDTSVAHLCGAMGIESWLCLPTNPDWRWGRDGSKSFWYPSIKIFRQDKKGSWESLFKDIQDELKNR